MTMLLFVSLAAATASVQTPGQGQDADQRQPAAIATNTPIDPDRNSVSAADRQICRRRVRIGTLAGFERECRTAAEWQALARGTGESWRQIQGTFGSTRDREGGLVCRPNGQGC